MGWRLNTLSIFISYDKREYDKTFIYVFPNLYASKCRNHLTSHFRFSGHRLGVTFTSSILEEPLIGLPSFDHKALHGAMLDLSLMLRKTDIYMTSLLLEIQFHPARRWFPSSSRKWNLPVSLSLSYGLSHVPICSRKPCRYFATITLTLEYRLAPRTHYVLCKSVYLQRTSRTGDLVDLSF